MAKEQDRKAMVDELAALQGVYTGVEARAPAVFDEVDAGTYSTQCTSYSLRRTKPKEEGADTYLMLSLYCRIREEEDNAGRMLFPAYFIDGPVKEDCQDAVAKVMGLLEAAGIAWDSSEMTALLGCMDRFIEADPVITINHQRSSKSDRMNSYINSVEIAGAEGAAVQDETTGAAI